MYRTSWKINFDVAILPLEVYIINICVVEEMPVFLNCKHYEEHLGGEESGIAFKKQCGHLLNWGNRINGSQKF